MTLVGVAVSLLRTRTLGTSLRSPTCPNHEAKPAQCPKP